LSYPFFQVANSLGNSFPRFLLNLLTAAVVVSLGIGRVPVLPAPACPGFAVQSGVAQAQVSGAEGAGSLPGLITFLGMAALALLLDALIAVLIGLAAFWIEEIAPLFWIYQKLLFTVGGMFLPLEMFPRWLRSAVRWLPFQLITYAPARAFVAFDPDLVLRAMLGQVAYIVLLSALIALTWQQAQRRLVVHGG
jgi:ABC-2 type transport system permease protein